MIKEIVSGIIEMYGTNDPFELCDFLNIKIMQSNLGQEIKGFFQRTKNGYEILHLNSELIPDEEKYICAHELGHAILHTDLSLQFFIENKLQIKNKYEIQADKFAAELLINAVDKPLLENMTINQMSYYYKVPIELIKYKFHIE
jgi:Zn-dependent peptidase ImmA (M78 family)